MIGLHKKRIYAEDQSSFLGVVSLPHFILCILFEEDLVILELTLLCFCLFNSFKVICKTNSLHFTTTCIRLFLYVA